MCTAISINGNRHFFGRTLDVRASYGEEIIITPRFAPLLFSDGSEMKNHLAIIGIGVISEGAPLYFDAMNEAGVCCAALRFPKFAKYLPPTSQRKNIASFELIPCLLSRCKSVSEAKEELSCARITDTPFSASLPPEPLHWIISDENGSITVEQTEDGLKIYDNPYGVLTNAPEFPFHERRLSEFSALSPRNPEGEARENTPYFSGGYGALGLPGDFSSPSRFVRAHFLLKNTQMGDDGVGAFFHIMDSVSIPNGAIVDGEGLAHRTVYTSCMDREELTYYFCTYENRRIRALRLDGRASLLASPIHIPIASAEDIRYLSIDFN